ncbi:DHA2 family efflux MFS transporter permease subunit [Pseudacidobacterium ailaaui]|jgi:DHA2 family multidrug resistance protein|uniref:DHA2 family efflux MFS transporter permease subunit n=1 Tax=Pseudacidobacterium ailaaui TaxID=1382359 RepID=UPI0005D26FEE|nr:DHA2 family efflux MFS transporter permease subunit [Pseudacidobacterium ailaaui]MBX6358759.1 DHA2 family efflux MFS transporter permease subunit [Pseudacidobacterium ailaaui]MCL6464922.1 DHA2 family efflux MFS transporter permease subunit [Pseudacidobacterium ailaaui]MDI3253957.1 DHA2 family efflux MFS transporter permease subunit [Bacillota bacterium]
MATQTLAAPEALTKERWRPRANPWAIAATVALAAFMEVLDTSIANVALPHIAGSLGASQDESTWVLTAYLVSNAVVLPMGGWAASIMGRKNFFMFCITIFTLSSFLCGIAPTLGILLVARVLQGFGGGGLQPMAQAIMADSFEPSKRGLAFALYGIVAILAPSIGPTLGGWITDNYSWHWIFYINIPVGILALVLVQRMVDDPPWIKADRSRLRNVDGLGIALLIISMAALQITLDKGEEKDWFQSDFIRFFGTTFAISFAALLFWEWHTKNPIMELRLFKNKNFATCCFLMLFTGGLLNATTVLQPQFLQAQLGYTATIAGLSLSAGGLVLLLMMPLAGQAVSRFPARNIILFGFACFAFSYYFTATRINLGLSFGMASWLRIVQIFSIPFVFISITTAAYFGMPVEKNNQVAGLINFVRNIGGSILISITNAGITELGQFHQDQMLKHLTPSNANLQRQISALSGVFTHSAGSANADYLAQGQIYNQLLQQSQALAYKDMYFILCAASLIMIPLSLLLRKNKPGAGGEIAVH